MKKSKTMHAPIYDARTLGVPKMTLLGLQHTFAMFGATVLVPLITGLDVSTTLLFAGIGTLLFHFLTKMKVPAFLGSSFAFLAGYAQVAPRLQDGTANLQMLPYACGGVFVAGLFYLVLSALIKSVGVKKVMKFFPPVVTGPIIISIGLILAPTAIDNASTDWLLAAVAIGTIILCNLWGKGMIRIIPIMMGVFVSYICALLLNRVNFTDIVTTANSGFAGILSLPIHRSAFMKFDLSAILTIAPIALATMMEHIGDISAISATTGRNYIEEPGLHRTLLGDGIATSLAAVFGAPANTTYGENTGVLALSKVYDPRVIRIAACFAILLSFIPTVAAVIRSIPVAIIGGVSMILYGMISAVGLRNVVENKVDFSKGRNLIIAAVILVSALGFHHTGGISFMVAGYKVTLSGLAIASIFGIVLNMILPGEEYDFEPDDEEMVDFEINP